jgi:hypothetical protein
MFPKIELAVLSVALLAGACEDALYGNGERATETRPVADFTRVESAGSVDVRIEQGEAFGVIVSVDSNVLPELRTRVVGETLVIDSQRDFEDLVPGPHVFVTLPALRAASLSGSGALGVAAPQPGQPLALDLSGSGDLLFDGAASDTTVRLSGSGNVALRGSSDWLDLKLDGSGDINAAEWRAANGRLKLSGSGSIRASLSSSVEVDLDGSGDVYLYGEPDILRLSIDGSGELHQR